MKITDLENKIVLITGAASGIGLEVALAFAKEGAKVIATDIQEDALAKVQSQIEALGGSCTSIVLNVADRDAWQALASSLAKDNRVPDVLVNNAGIGYIAGFVETTEEMWRRTLDINVLGVAFGCEAFIPSMKASGTPKQLVNVASMASRTPLPNVSAYVASKWAVEGLTDSIAIELSDTAIGALCVHPGVINTPIVRNRQMMGASISEQQADRLQNYYTSKGCHPSVVANDIVAAVKRGSVSLPTGPNTRFTCFIVRLMPKKMLRKFLLKMAGDAGYWDQTSGN